MNPERHLSPLLFFSWKSSLFWIRNGLAFVALPLENLIGKQVKPLPDPDPIFNPYPTPDTGPYFDLHRTVNVTALKGVTTHLVCRVKRLGNHTVSLLFSSFTLGDSNEPFQLSFMFLLTGLLDKNCRHEFVDGGSLHVHYWPSIWGISLASYGWLDRPTQEPKTERYRSLRMPNIHHTSPNSFGPSGCSR